MKLDKIEINNFKSIEKLEFNIQKYGDSYTTMLLGINEAGKSNILQAISFLEEPEDKQDYLTFHNQKDDDNSNIDILFNFSFKDKDTYQKKIRTKIKHGHLLDFEITNIRKSSFQSQTSDKFLSWILYDIKYTGKFLIKRTPEDKLPFVIMEDGETTKSKLALLDNYKELTIDFFKEIFAEDIEEIIKSNLPKVSFWKPSDKYLLPSSINLYDLVDNIELNIPVKNIFKLSGYKTQADINKIIENLHNQQARRRLMSKLSADTTSYIKSIWRHKTSIDLEISDTGSCTISIKDDGKKNEHNYFEMSARSEGFKQFMSLILSLSIESEKDDIENRLILIDEPETHLHPSGIRDLGKELLKIGKNNYLFVATHSPFIIDRECMERNIIIKKNSSAQTIKKEITKQSDLRDDEVLTEAFGISPYRDLLNPHRILVEGSSDKVILNKAFAINKLEYGITNGIGSNIVNNATKYNHDDFKIHVIVDDDKEGRKYRDDIIKIGGVFDKNNVHTIRDLVGSMSNEGTIEDLLSKVFIEKKYKEFYKEKFNEECALQLQETPFIEQIKIHLLKEKKLGKEELNTTLNKFKKKVSEDFKPTKSSFMKSFPLLHDLVDKIST